MKKFFFLFLFSLSIYSQSDRKIFTLAEKYHNCFNASIHKPTDSASFFLDKLKKITEQNQQEIFKIWYHQDVGYTLFVKGKNRKSILIYKKSLDLAIKNNLPNEIINCKNWIANNYILLNENKKATQLFKEILNIAKKEKSIDALITAWTGLSNDTNLTINEQLNLNLKIDSICTKNNIETPILANIYNWIGKTYLDYLNNEKLALKYFEKSLQIAKNVDYEPGIKYTTMLLSDIALNKKEYDKAKKHYQSLVQLYKTHDSILVANCYIELSKIARLENKNTLSLNYLKKSFRIFKKLKDSLGLINNEFFKAKTNLHFKKFSAVKNSITKLDKLLDTKSSLQYLVDLYNLKSNFYNETNNYKKAILFNKKSDSLQKLVFKHANLKKFAEIEVKYQSNKKEHEIVLLKAKNELVIQQKKNQKFLFFGSLILSSLIGLFFFIQYRNRKKLTDKLQQLDELKSTLFTNISHEFRTPLTLISGPIQHLLKNERLEVEDKNNLKIMHRNSKRLLILVNQLLDISKIESGNIQLKIEKNNLLQFTNFIIESFHFSIKEKALEFNYSNNSTNKDTWFDKDFIEKIIVNLVSNAIKYTPKNGSIICDAYLKGSFFYFTIKNTGKGLSKEEINKVFERFYQKNKTNQGVGIGLALVKELVELHKGTIKVTSTLNQWTNFKVIIPINKESYNKNEFVEENLNKSKNTKLILEQNPIDQEHNENPILLIIDDHKDIRDYIASIFNKKYVIFKAKNGQEGIEMAIEYIPDIIISDIMMPIKNGIELCNTLKQDERTSHIPIILLTAKTGNTPELEGIESGADDYTTKPFNEDILIKKVENLITNRKKLQERYSQEVILRPTDIAINSSEEKFLEKIQKIIDNDIIDTSFTIDAFSKNVGMSRMQLHRKLKALFGMSTTEFIRSQRLKLAAELLKNSNVTVSQIGYSVGFNDHAYFSKRFKEVYNCTPSKYVNTFKK